MKKFIPLIVLAVALTISLWYVFNTNFLTVYDASRALALYNHYRADVLLWHPMTNEMQLQNTGLLDTYLPAMLQRVLRIEPVLFYKLYLALVVAFVPLVTYFIGRKLIGMHVGIVSAVVVMGWVAFYQGGSFGRLNVAVIIFGLLVLTMLGDSKYKIVKLVSLSALLPLAHYGTAFIAVPILAGTLAWTLLRDRRRATYVSVILVTLLLVISIWHGVVNNGVALYPIKYMVSGRVAPVAAENVPGDVNTPSQITDNPSWLTKTDKISQALVGVADPDGDGTWTLNYLLLLFAWVMIMTLLIGVLRAILSREIPALYKVVCLLSLTGVAVVFLLPQLSRGYGVEKVYYQAIVVAAPCFYLGAGKLSGWLRLKSTIWVEAVILLPYTALMYKFGVIPSVLG